MKTVLIYLKSKRKPIEISFSQKRYDEFLQDIEDSLNFIVFEGLIISKDDISYIIERK